MENQRLHFPPCSLLRALMAHGGQGQWRMGQRGTRASTPNIAAFTKRGGGRVQLGNGGRRWVTRRDGLPWETGLRTGRSFHRRTLRTLNSLDRWRRFAGVREMSGGAASAPLAQGRSGDTVSEMLHPGKHHSYATLWKRVPHSRTYRTNRQYHTVARKVKLMPHSGPYYHSQI